MKIVCVVNVENLLVYNVVNALILCRKCRNHQWRYMCSMYASSTERSAPHPVMAGCWTPDGVCHHQQRRPHPVMAGCWTPDGVCHHQQWRRRQYDMYGQRGRTQHQDTGGAHEKCNKEPGNFGHTAGATRAANAGARVGDGRGGGEGIGDRRPAQHSTPDDVRSESMY